MHWFVYQKAQCHILSLQSDKFYDFHHLIGHHNDLKNSQQEIQENYSVPEEGINNNINNYTEFSYNSEDIKKISINLERGIFNYTISKYRNKKINETWNTLFNNLYINRYINACYRHNERRK